MVAGWQVIYNLHVGSARCISLKLHGPITVRCTKHTPTEQEIRWKQRGVDWLQIYLSNLRILFFHSHGSIQKTMSDSDFRWFLPKQILHRCWKQKEMHMLNIMRAAIFSPLMQMLLFRQIPTRQEESSSPSLPSVLPSSSTYEIMQLCLGHDSSERDDSESSLGQFRILMQRRKTPCVSPGVPRDDVLIRSRQTGWN